jgi:hypothetical protein
MRRGGADSEQAEHGVAGVVGVLGDRDERSGTGQDRARADQQHREHAMAHPARAARVRDLGQGVEQRQRRPFDTDICDHLIEDGVRLDQGSNDRRG